MEAVGQAVVVPEKYQDAVTAVSGSGPAYLFFVVEAMIDAGVMLGLPRDISTTLVNQTMFGSAKLLIESNKHPNLLREMVTSPAGTTAAALRQLEERSRQGGLHGRDGGRARPVRPAGASRRPDAVGTVWPTSVRRSVDAVLAWPGARQPSSSHPGRLRFGGVLRRSPRGFCHQEASQADGQEEAPQAAEEDAHPAPPRWQVIAGAPVSQSDARVVVLTRAGCHLCDDAAPHRDGLPERG